MSLGSSQSHAEVEMRISRKSDESDRLMCGSLGIPEEQAPRKQWTDVVTTMGPPGEPAAPFSGFIELQKLPICHPLEPQHEKVTVDSEHK